MGDELLQVENLRTHYPIRKGLLGRAGGAARAGAARRPSPGASFGWFLRRVGGFSFGRRTFCRRGGVNCGGFAARLGLSFKILSAPLTSGWVGWWGGGRRGWEGEGGEGGGGGGGSWVIGGGGVVWWGAGGPNRVSARVF